MSDTWSHISSTHLLSCLCCSCSCCLSCSSCFICFANRSLSNSAARFLHASSCAHNLTWKAPASYLAVSGLNATPPNSFPPFIHTFTCQMNVETLEKVTRIQGMGAGAEFEKILRMTERRNEYWVEYSREWLKSRAKITNVKCWLLLRINFYHTAFSATFCRLPSSEDSSSQLERRGVHEE